MGGYAWTDPMGAPRGAAARLDVEHPATHIERHRDFQRIATFAILAIGIVAFPLMFWWIYREEPSGATYAWILVASVVVAIPIAWWGVRNDAWTDDGGINFTIGLSRHRLAWNEISRVIISYALGSVGKLNSYRVELATKGGEVFAPSAWSAMPRARMERLRALASERGVEVVMPTS